MPPLGLPIAQVAWISCPTQRWVVAWSNPPSVFHNMGLVFGSHDRLHGLAWYIYAALRASHLLMCWVSWCRPERHQGGAYFYLPSFCFRALHAKPMSTLLGRHPQVNLDCRRRRCSSFKTRYVKTMLFFRKIFFSPQLSSFSLSDWLIRRGK